MQDFQNNNYHRHIVHVHGRYDEPRYLVLTERDYAVYVQPLVDQFWRSVPVRGHFVFVGWSFNDADLAQNFRRFEMIFQEANPKTPRHFAIMHPISDSNYNSSSQVYLLVNIDVSLVMHYLLSQPLFDGVYGAEGKMLHLIGMGLVLGRGSRAHAAGERESERANEKRILVISLVSSLCTAMASGSRCKLVICKLRMASSLSAASFVCRA